jgi:sugar (pentulose or hexulose) kinase
MYLGLDFGTSALKAAIVDSDGRVLYQSRHAWEQSPTARPDPNDWWQGLSTFFAALPESYRTNLHALSIAATSGTLLALNTEGKPCSRAFWYAAAPSLHPKISDFCQKNPDHPAASASSALNKACYLLEEHPETAALRSQGDWLTGKLLGHYRFGDSHNALKLGFDPVNAVFLDLPIHKKLLPEIQPPLTDLGVIAEDLATTWGLAKHLRIFSGCTDSNAAFMASGAEQLGDALTSLGSTLVIKIISAVAIFDGARGLYSHRLPSQGDKKFLVGGASNVGMAVFNAYFSEGEIQYFSNLPYCEPSGLDYYPLLEIGERFPFADPDKAPKLTPRPEEKALFFQGIAEGIAKVEEAGYEALAAAGAPWPKRVFSVGGGSKNNLLTSIRRQKFALVPSLADEAAVGLARWLAKAAI